MSLLGNCVMLGLFAAAAAASADSAPLHPAAHSPLAAAPAPKRVLVLYDEDKDNFPGLASTDRSLRESLRARLGKPVEIHSEFFRDDAGRAGAAA